MLSRYSSIKQRGRGHLFKGGGGTFVQFSLIRVVLIQRGEGSKAYLRRQALTQDIGVGVLIFNNQLKMEKLGVLIGCKCLNQNITVRIFLITFID